MKGVYLKKGNTRVSVVPYYRVGDLFLTTIATNPSNFLGGTWELFGPGRCLVCVNTSDNDFNTVKKTGGNKEMQKHRHSGSTGKGYTDFMRQVGLAGTSAAANHAPGYQSAGYVDVRNTSNFCGGNHWHDFTTSYEGNGDSGNLQPYITCYIWIRTA